MVKKKKLKLRIVSLPSLLVSLIVLLLLGTLVLRTVYINNLKPVSNSTTTTYFTVTSGSGVDQISSSLKSAGLIKSSSSLKNYVRSNELADKLQAGTYLLSPSMSAQEIIKKMITGDVAKNLITILPGKTIAELKSAFAAAGYTPGEIATAFSPSTYTGMVLLSNLPKGASLEGFLYPDSFQKTAETPASTIVRESLDEMSKHLTADITNGFSNHGLSVYQGVVLASIVYQETDDPASMPTVAQVFLSRIAKGMKLESNVTANYAADLAGVTRNVNINSPYNTYLISGLPPGPISNVTSEALKAVAHPGATDYLFFIAGDDDKMHFTHTQAEHDQAIIQYCQKKCAQP